MITQGKVIFFCYAYVIGIVIAMLVPMDPVAVVPLNVAAVLLVAGVVAHFAWGSRRPGTAPSSSRVLREGLLLLVAGALLGYARYMAANTVPDTRAGEIRVDNGVGDLRLDEPLDDTCRLRLRKIGETGQDVAIRLHGELDARVPVRDGEGNATLDAKARWRFRVARLPQASDVVVLRAADPVGTDYVVDQPFTRVTRVEVVRGDAAAIGVYRLSNHIGSFVRPARAQSPVTILGRISADPRVYDFKTILTVTPYFVQFPAGGPFYRVEGGDIRVTIRPNTTNYAVFARTEAYGYDVEIQGELSAARPAANPGGFDDRRFLQNYNVYGVMSLFQPPGGASPIHAVRPAGRETRRGNPLVEFSLDLRDRMLRTLKLTLPYPHSAFLGAVTLGLRYGLQGVECIQSDRYRGEGTDIFSAGTREDRVHRGCEELIAEEFKESGVNHVLAVSGLHVTIIMVMFMGLFALLRMPQRVYVPAIIVVLIIFAIITGARPSVLRAVIMNSLFLLVWAYLGQGLRSSALLGVPVAAFLILLQNPLVIVDASFTLSFGAILSLALLTGPAYELLCRLRGNAFLAFLLILAGTTTVGILRWPLLVTPSYLVVHAIVCAAVVAVALALDRKGLRLPGKFAYAEIPPGAGAFLAAQFGIQLGMMLPLSAYYFSRWPFAGAYANLIAIPLIGVVVQLGAMAGLLGMIPAVGFYLGLVLSAANWVFSSAFLWLAHFAAALFPYPFVRRPSIRFLIAYYLLCALFVWHGAVWRWLTRSLERVRPGRAAPALAFAGLVLLASTPAWVRPREPGAGTLRVTVLSVGYGSSILVETPQGRRILVDAGFVEHQRGRQNTALRTILPFLCHRGIRHLDALVLTSPRPERVAGAAFLLEHCWIDRLCVPPSLAGLSEGEPYEGFVGRFGDGETLDEYDPALLRTMYEEIVGNPSWPRRPSLAKALAQRGGSLPNRWAGWATPVQAVTSADTLFEEEGAGGTFRVEVLNPGTDGFTEFPLDNEAVVLRLVYGRFAMLLTSDLHYRGQDHLADVYSADQLRADVMTVPHHGAALPPGGASSAKDSVEAQLRRSLNALLDKVRPATVITEFGNPRPVLFAQARDVEHTEELTARYLADRLGPEACLRTDRDMAVFVQSDGAGYAVRTQAEMNRLAGGEEAVEDIDVGL